MTFNVNKMRTLFPKCESNFSENIKTVSNKALQTETWEQTFPRLPYLWAYTEDKMMRNSCSRLKNVYHNLIPLRVGNTNSS